MSIADVVIVVLLVTIVVGTVQSVRGMGRKEG